MATDQQPAYPSAIPGPIFRVLLDLLAVIEDESERLAGERDRAAQAIDDLAELAECVGKHVDVLERRPVLDPTAVGWGELPQYEAVERILAATRIPMTRAEIGEALGTVGRDDDLRQVSSGLDYLRRQGRAASDDQHRWHLVFADAEPASA